MTVDGHMIVTALIGIVCALLGWLGKSLLQAVRDLERDLALLRERVAGEYVRQDRLAEALKPLMDALTEIRDKLDRKADKAGNHLA